MATQELREAAAVRSRPAQKKCPKPKPLNLTNPKPLNPKSLNRKPLNPKPLNPINPNMIPRTLPGPWMRFQFEDSVVYPIQMGGCQNYGPFLSTLNIRYCIIIGIQKGTHNFDNHPNQDFQSSGNPGPKKSMRPATTWYVGARHREGEPPRRQSRTELSVWGPGVPPGGQRFRLSHGKGKPELECKVCLRDDLKRSSPVSPFCIVFLDPALPLKLGYTKQKSKRCLLQFLFLGYSSP